MNTSPSPRGAGQARVVIIGGGVAGLAASITLRRRGYECVVCERNRPADAAGMGFLMLPNGLEALDEIGVSPEIVARGVGLSHLEIRSPRGNLVRIAPVAGSIGLERGVLLDVLRRVAVLEGVTIRDDWRLSSFVYRDGLSGEIYGAREIDGEIMRGDLFIGADGLRARSRAELFPGSFLSIVRIVELVGLTPRAALEAATGDHLMKLHDVPGRAAFGTMPVSREHVIWYAQFAADQQAIPDEDGAPRRRYLLERFAEWSPMVREVLRACPFTETYRWFTADLDPLPSCYSGNAVVIGDAGHASSTLTSQGVSSALEDAVAIADALPPAARFSADTLELALTRFESRRRPIWNRRLREGRAMVEEFLHPEEHPLLPIAG